jgi:N-acetylglucosaminyl-diphospho-decaprenol L-rhamnosyltransferase
VTVPVGRPAVSIVIVAHSEWHELARGLQSIREHAGMPVQIIYVDNASTDDTLPWVRTHHPEVEIVELAQNIGVVARQHGLARAKAALTMFLDSDAALTPGALPTMVEAMRSNPSWGLIGPRLVGDDGGLQLSARRFPPRSLPLARRPPLSRWLEDSALVQRHLMADVDHDRTRPVLYVLGACQLFRMQLARSAGPFADWIFLGLDDADWCFRIRDAGGEVVYFPEATVVHTYRRRTNASPLSRAAWRHFRSFAQFQWRWRKRRRELVELQERLDREYGG